MDTQWKHLILRATGASACQRGEVIQSLWSGYGEIVRYHLIGAEIDSIVLKHVKFPSTVQHPRGWHNDHSHQRKVTSYEVEMEWYQHWAKYCHDACRVPHCYSAITQDSEQFMILEDLDASGFAQRKSELDLNEVRQCLSWMAHFHATFLGKQANNLWPVGSYWHLATRPDELAAMDCNNLRDAAPILDSMLTNCAFKTLIHGDAKVANFCFSDNGGHVAAVDFQYVGGGCGMKDVAYFLGSCLSDRDHEQYEAMFVDDYFNVLRQAITKDPASIFPDVDALEMEWRSLLPVAQADFYRFLVGWMPNHWKINDYNQRITQEVLANL